VYKNTNPPLHHRIVCNTQHQVYSSQWVHNLFVYVIMRYLFVYIIVLCIYAICILYISSFRILTISVIDLNSDVMITTPFSSSFYSYYYFFFIFFLKWNVHVHSLCSSLIKVPYIIKSLKAVLNIYMPKSIYIGFFQSHIRYGIIFWGEYNGSKMAFRVQRSAI